ncbi:hypothetical protein [Paenibacillus sp. YYML68]|uniref:hypothetical protein n=1 Tax=Paenibacillus sp. YYML68 TaxID=2909250 RepID=UPI00249062FE|nr:hypothetical protein [Paenibacillus sp. YYML68]
MNHLWIQFMLDEKSQQSEIQIQLPEGIYRSNNLNGLVENEREHIVVNACDREVFVEIFTRAAIECGEMTIVVSLWTVETTVTKEITIQIVEADEMDELEIDEQVIERIKELSNASPACDADSSRVTIQPRILETRDNKYSYLEREYRIDY